MNKNTIIIAFVILALLILGAALAIQLMPNSNQAVVSGQPMGQNQPENGQVNINQNTDTPANNQADVNKAIGGEKDAHGCLVSAGYVWCEIKSKCLRSFEEKCEVQAQEQKPKVDYPVVENNCTKSGGKISSAKCCDLVSDYPNTCVTGMCSCPAASSHDVKSCDCGAGKCFNGITCVSK